MMCHTVVPFKKVFSQHLSTTVSMLMIVYLYSILTLSDVQPIGQEHSVRDRPLKAADQTTRAEVRTVNFEKPHYKTL